MQSIFTLPILRTETIVAINGNVSVVSFKGLNMYLMV